MDPYYLARSRAFASPLIIKNFKGAEPPWVRAHDYASAANGEQPAYNRQRSRKQRSVMIYGACGRVKYNAAF
jgi:hypothetical protein